MSTENRKTRGEIWEEARRWLLNPQIILNSWIATEKAFIHDIIDFLPRVEKANRWVQTLSAHNLRLCHDLASIYEYSVYLKEHQTELRENWKKQRLRTQQLMEQFDKYILADDEYMFLYAAPLARDVARLTLPTFEPEVMKDKAKLDQAIQDFTTTFDVNLNEVYFYALNLKPNEQDYASALAATGRIISHLGTIKGRLERESALHGIFTDFAPGATKSVSAASEDCVEWLMG